MYTKNEHNQRLPITPLSRRMILGAVIGLAIISYFVLSVNHPNPNWPKLWMVRPLIITPLAGACGGIFYYAMDYLRYQRGWNKMLTTLIGLVGSGIGLWLGVVLGLAGTMWH